MGSTRRKREQSLPRLHPWRLLGHERPRGFRVGVTEGFLPKGWSVALPSYSLAPQATMAEICADIHTALDGLASEDPRTASPDL